MSHPSQCELASLPKYTPNLAVLLCIQRPTVSTLKSQLTFSGFSSITFQATAAGDCEFVVTIRTILILVLGEKREGWEDDMEKTVSKLKSPEKRTPFNRDEHCSCYPCGQGAPPDLQQRMDAPITGKDHYLYFRNGPLPIAARGSGPSLGDIYRHLVPDDKTKRILKEKGQPPGCFTVLQRVNKQELNVRGEPFLVFVHKGYLRQQDGFYGPLTAQELAEYLPLKWDLGTTMSFRVMVTDNDKKLLTGQIRTIALGDSVWIKVTEIDDWDDVMAVKEYNGVLRIKGPFFTRQENKIGSVHFNDMWIGIELYGKSAGKGHSDGCLGCEHHRFFTCRQNDALFLPIHEVSAIRVLKTVEAPAEALLQKLRSVESFSWFEEELTHGNSVLIEKVEELWKMALPFPTSYHVDWIVVSRELIDDYGRQKHLQNVQKFKKYFFVEFWNHGATHFLVVTVRGRVARDSIELVRDHFVIPHDRRACFQNPDCKVLQTVPAISGCSIRLSESNQTLILTGVKSEIWSAKLMLEEEMRGRQEDSKKSKPKKKKKNSPTYEVREVRVEVTEQPCYKEVKNKKNCVGITRLDGATGSDDVREPQKRTGKEISSVSEEIARLSLAEEKCCVICMSLPYDTAFVPCGHKQTCQNCANKLMKAKNPQCPTCRTGIERLLRIYE